MKNPGTELERLREANRGLGDHILEQRRVIRRLRKALNEIADMAQLRSVDRGMLTNQVKGVCLHAIRALNASALAPTTTRRGK